MNNHRFHDLILFRNDGNKDVYADFFHTVLTSHGKPKTLIINQIQQTMIVFFINVFLFMNCMTGFNETNVNRVLINYSPDSLDFVDDGILYEVVKEFKNLFWAKSHLKTWRLYSRFRTMLMHRLPNNIVSMADIVISIIFMQASGIIQINPIYHMNTVYGKPFVIKEVISRYWFMKGLKYNEVFEYKFHQEDYFKWRKKQYIKQCSEHTALLTLRP